MLHDGEERQRRRQYRVAMEATAEPNVADRLLMQLVPGETITSRMWILRLVGSTGGRAGVPARSQLSIARAKLPFGA